MTKDEAVRLALEALEYHQDQTRPIRRTIATITALRKALDEPVQKPVAYINAVDDWAGFPKLVVSDKPKEGFKPVYLAPPRREWVGLTDEEIWSDGDSFVTSEAGIKQFARAIEARLKEKNHENHTE